MFSRIGMVFLLASSFIIGGLPTAKAMVPVRVAIPNGKRIDLRQILRCRLIDEQFVCTIRVFIEEELPEEVIANERIDITPGGWGVDPNNGNCSDCMTPYPQYTDPPPDPVIDDLDACNDERDLIIAEYMTGAMASVWVPGCGDFATGGSSTHFTWSELNRSPGSGHSFGIVKSTLWTALEATRTAYQNQAIYVSSGYRCPHGNASLTPPGSTTSRHMRGDAVDMRRSGGTWDEAEFDTLKAAAEANGFSRTFTWTTYADHHLHADQGGQ